MAKSASDTEETRTRSRTRRAILDAAVAVLGEKRKAPLSEVAQEAGVARSTLQRYFPERSDLICALDEYATERIDEATRRARPAEGTGIDALQRLVAEYFDLNDIVLLAWGHAPEDETVWQQEPEDNEHALYALIERGHADGTLDPAVGPLWAEQLLWSHLYSAWMFGAGTGVSRHEALGMCLYTLLKAVGAPGAESRVPAPSPACTAAGPLRPADG